MTIKTDMIKLIKKKDIINKKDLFESIKETEEDKQDALIKLLEDGYIFEMRPQEFRWLGD